jgi:hypothetical protein
MNAFERYHQSPLSEQEWLEREEQSDRFDEERLLRLEIQSAYAREETHLREAADYDPDNILHDSGCTAAEIRAYDSFVRRPAQRNLFEREEADHAA